MLSGWSGVDFSQYQPTDKVEYIQTNAIQSLLFLCKFRTCLDHYWNSLNVMDPERMCLDH
ncbi:hypothetical protein AB3548_01970 [Acinetobacter baumannii]